MTGFRNLSTEARGWANQIIKLLIPLAGLPGQIEAGAGNRPCYLILFSSLNLMEASRTSIAVEMINSQPASSVR